MEPDRNGQNDRERYAPGQYGQGQYEQGQYGQSQYEQGQYGQSQYEQGQYEQGQYGQSQYGQNRYGGWAPAAAPRPARARTGVIVLTALLMEIVVIAAACNQWVSDKIARDVSASTGDRLVENSVLTYTWRLTPGRLNHQQWLAQILLIAGVLVLTGLLVAALCRGPVTWGRAFFGTWLAVVFATLVSAVVRGFVDPVAKLSLPGTNRVIRALYGPSGPSSVTVIGALVLGLVVALVTSIVAVASRRPAVLGENEAADPRSGQPAQFADYGPPAPSAPAAPPPWQDQPTTGIPVRDAGEQPTAQHRREQPPARSPEQSAVQSAEQPTVQQPRDEPVAQQSAAQQSAQQRLDPRPDDQQAAPPAAEQPPPQQPAEPPSGQPSAAQPNQPTARFPRPPDDEDLGHVDH